MSRLDLAQPCPRAPLTKQEIWNLDPLHSAADVSGLEVAYANADLIQTSGQPRVKFVDCSAELRR